MKSPQIDHIEPAYYASIQHKRVDIFSFQASKHPKDLLRRIHSTDTARAEGKTIDNAIGPHHHSCQGGFITLLTDETLSHPKDTQRLLSQVQPHLESRYKPQPTDLKLSASRG